MRQYWWISLLLLSLGFSSCKALKKKTVVAEEMTANLLHRNLVKQQVKADWLNAKTKIGFDDGSMRQSATADIRMIRDSLVWLSVRKLGFELARAQITKDSVYVLDRFNKQYAVESLDYLNDSYNLPANLKSIQAILLGNPVFFTLNNFSFAEDELAYKLQSEGKITANYTIGKSDFRLQQMQFEEKEKNQLVTIELENYMPVAEEQMFSYLRKINANAKSIGEVQISLEFTKVELDQPKTIRFEIPSNYKRMD